MPKKQLLLSVVLLSCVACGGDGSSEPSAGEPTTLSGEYVGQTPPGLTPRQFLPDVITEEVHSTTVLSPHANEVYWTLMERGAMRFMQQVDGLWTSPAEVFLGGSDDAAEPCFSPDGGRLYFISQRRPNVPEILQKENIWYVERTGAGWGEPVILGPVVNDLELHWSFSIADNGNLYYGGHPIAELSFDDIHVAEYRDGAYVRLTRLNGGINTELTETTPFVAPDESYLMFSRVEIDGSNADLYICFRDQGGTWTSPVSMEALNTGAHELCPNVTRDGRFLFFMSTRSGSAKPHWVSAAVIDTYR